MSETTQTQGYVDRIRSDFTTEAWVLIPIGVGINVVGGTIIQTLRIPLFMDTIGTMLVAILAGPFVGIVAGVLTNIVLGFTAGPQLVPFAIVNAVIAVVAGVLAQRGWLQIEDAIEYWKLVAAGLLTAVVATIFSAPISVYGFGGVTPGAQGALTSFFLASGQGLWESVIGASGVSEPIDKTVSFFVAYAIARAIPVRYLPRQGMDALGES
jgi:energy-coupling factor transport system substrate-specific component